MAFRVIYAPAAVLDLEEYFEIILPDSEERAKAWLRGATSAIMSLQDMPKRHAVIGESALIGVILRSLPYHSHRIIYRVDDDEMIVEIARVWHMARRELGEADLT